MPKSIHTLVALVTLAVSAANVTAQSSPYVLQVRPSKKVVATLTYRVAAPRLDAKEWIVYSTSAPQHPAQGGVKSTMSPAAKLAKSTDGYPRDLLLARQPVRGGPLTKGIEAKVQHQAQLYARKLAPRQRGVRYPPVKALTEEERKHALAVTSLCQHDSPEFAKLLKNTGLTRARAESDIDYARRVFLAIKSGFTYEYTTKMDRWLNAVCQAKKSDCGGLSIVFVSAMRANGIPARLLVGRWAISSKQGERVGDIEYHQQHVKAEFYAEGVGWVPVDPSSAILHDRSREGLKYFGNDPGDFLIMHLDHDLELDSIHFGKHNITWMQGVSWWVTGQGKLDGWKAQTHWAVTESR